MHRIASSSLANDVTKHDKRKKKRISLGISKAGWLWEDQLSCRQKKRDIYLSLSFVRSFTCVRTGRIRGREGECHYCSLYGQLT